MIPTDTLYGIVGSALNKKTVGAIYKLRKRSPQKPFIILIGSVNDLELFGITIDKKTRSILDALWPGKVSVVLPCGEKKFFYLHRGTKTLAFRVPKNKWLTKLLKKTGPLAAPSANFEGLPPALTISAAKRYFGRRIDFYIDAGRSQAKPSTLVKIKGNKVFVMREGTGRIPEKLINK